MDASNLIDRLRFKHAQDVFVPECKDGPTHGAKHRRLDAWVLLKTWSPPTCIGYEVKVSRGDWLGDRKWEGYRELVNLLYLVAPKGLVKPDELPEGVGLMEAVGKESSAGLRTVRKAVRREGFPPPELLYYVLMNRFDAHRAAKESVDPVVLRAQRIEMARKHLENRRDGREIDRIVKHGIHERLRDQDNLIFRLQSARDFLAKNGIDENCGNWEIERELQRRLGLDAKVSVLNAARRLEHDIAQVRRSLEAVGAHEGTGR